MSSDSINRNFISFFFGKKLEQTRSDLKAEHQHRKPRSFVRTKKYPLIYDFIFFHPWKSYIFSIPWYYSTTTLLLPPDKSHGTVQVYNHTGYSVTVRFVWSITRFSPWTGPSSSGRACNGTSMGILRAKRSRSSSVSCQILLCLDEDIEIEREGHLGCRERLIQRRCRRISPAN